MLVTADEVGRSLRGTVALLNRRTEGLKAFDFSSRGFFRSFAAIWLTLPAYVVTLALERQRLGLARSGEPLFADPGLVLLEAAGHVAGFVALPLAMIVVARRLGLGGRYVPFVVVTNWIGAVGLTVLSIPGLMLLAGWATPHLAGFFSLAFVVIILRLHWFATKVTLAVPGGLAALIVAFGLGLNVLIASAVHAMAS